MDKARDVAVYMITFGIFYLYGLELVSVIGLQHAPHTKIEEPVFVLHHTVNIVARHRVRLLRIFLVYIELVSVVAV